MYRKTQKTYRHPVLLVHLIIAIVFGVVTILLFDCLFEKKKQVTVLVCKLTRYCVKHFCQKAHLSNTLENKHLAQ